MRLIITCLKKRSHQVVGVEGRLVAARALALADEDLLAPHLCGRCLGGIEFAKDVELRRRRKVQHLLKIGHEVDLAAALKGIHALLGGDYNIAVEIGTGRCMSTQSGHPILY
jgi:hypothetical protein